MEKHEQQRSILDSVFKMQVSRKFKGERMSMKGCVPARHCVGHRLHIASMLGKAIRLPTMFCVLLLHVLKFLLVSHDVIFGKLRVFVTIMLDGCYFWEPAAMRVL